MLGRTARLLTRPEFDGVSIRIPNEELRPARSPAAIANPDPLASQLGLRGIERGHRQGEMPVVPRRIVMSRYLLDTHQVQLLSVVQVVPPASKTQIRTRQRREPEHSFVKSDRPFQVGHQNPRVMNAFNRDGQSLLPRGGPLHTLFGQ